MIVMLQKKVEELEAKVASQAKLLREKDEEIEKVLIFSFFNCFELHGSFSVL